MNVKLIKMWSGEDVIADLIKENDDSIFIKNPITLVPSDAGQQGQEGKEGQVKLVPVPWSPLLKGMGTELEVTKRYVVYINEPQQEAIDNYTQMFSAIPRNGHFWKGA